MSKLTHLDEDGKAKMVDVGDKTPTKRTAIATGKISMKPETLDLVISGTNKKGDVLAVARIAGIMAAKKTSELIPLCHPLNITKIDIDLELDKVNSFINCTALVETIGQTGVEIEALNATQISLLTIYDMCKAADKGMIISEVQLKEKRGGRSGHWSRSKA
jgi:cyclic pyranopterin monophosphate synthase